MATVKGRVDVITLPEGKRLLRDYKTAQEPSDGDVDNTRVVHESAIQISLYALGEHGLGRPVDGASIAFLKSGKLLDVPTDSNSLEKARRQALSAVEGILQKSFAGRSCDFCDECDYRRICRYTRMKAKDHRRR